MISILISRMMSIFIKLYSDPVSYTHLNSIRKDTRVVIVDASAINSIDVTAADRLDAISASLKKRGIRFYLTEHSTQILSLIHICVSSP